MARIRSVHPNICESVSMTRVSARAERTFVRLWTYCDDEGRAKADRKLLKAALYPLHDDMTADEVQADIDELAAEGLIVLYRDVRGVDLLTVPSWSLYQKPQRPTPSKLQQPPRASRKDTGALAESSANTHGTLHAGVEIGEGEGEGGKRRRKTPGTPPPASFDLDSRIEGWTVTAECRQLGINLRRETERFLDYHRAKGTLMASWDAGWRTWMANAVRFEEERRAKQHGNAFTVNGS